MQYKTDATANSAWTRQFRLTQYSGGPPIDLTGLTWRFVVRKNLTDIAQPALIQVQDGTTTGQGSITVTPVDGLVLVNLTPAATVLLGQGVYFLNLWSNPDDEATKKSWVDGALTSRLVAAS